MIKCYLFLFVLLTSCFNCEKYYSNRFRPLEFNGVIDTLYLDKKNHLAKCILFKNQSKMNGIIGENDILYLYENAEKGDRIYKAKGSLAVYLYKKDTTLVLYPVCNGDTLK